MLPFSGAILASARARLRCFSRNAWQSFIFGMLVCRLRFRLPSSQEFQWLVPTRSLWSGWKWWKSARSLKINLPLSCLVFLRLPLPVVDGGHAHPSPRRLIARTTHMASLWQFPRKYAKPASLCKPARIEIRRYKILSVHLWNNLGSQKPCAMKCLINHVESCRMWWYGRWSVSSNTGLNS